MSLQLVTRDATSGRLVTTTVDVVYQMNSSDLIPPIHLSKLHPYLSWYGQIPSPLKTADKV